MEISVEKKREEQEKKKKLIFKRVCLIVLVIFLVNASIFISKYIKNKNVTGLGVTETIVGLYSNMSPTARVFIAIQWIVLLLLLIFVFFKEKVLKSEGDELRGIDLKEMSKNSKTDLDTLYNILKEKKQLRITSISKLFNVSKEIALEWCKILESKSIVTIEYPSAREAVVRLIEEE